VINQKLRQDKQAEAVRQECQRLQSAVNLLQYQVSERDRKLREFEKSVYQSTSWKITYPLRVIGSITCRIRRFKNIVWSLMTSGRSFKRVFRKINYIYRNEGLRGLQLYFRSVRHLISRLSVASASEPINTTTNALKVIGQGTTVPGQKKIDSFNLSGEAKPSQLLLAEDNFEQRDCPLKIVVVTHVFHLDVVPDLIIRIRNIAIKHDLIVTVPAEKRAALEGLLDAEELSAIILEVENHGYDILPFLKSIPAILEGGYDLVCKLHTKKGLANLEKHYPDAGNIWLDMLIDPIMGSREAVRQILYAFSNDPSLGMLGSADLYKASRHLTYDNNLDVTRLVLQLSATTDPGKPWGFFAGTIFWCRPQILKPLLSLLPELERAPGSLAETGETRSIWHALERVMGLLPRLSGFHTGLAYALSPNKTDVRVILAQTGPLQDGSPYGVGSSISSFLEAQKNWKFLYKSPEFCEEFYVQAYPYVIEMGFEPLYHYLRYGIYEGCNPSLNFSSAWYWDEYQDTNRFNPLIHYLKYGLKEGRCSFPAVENLEGIIRLVESTGLFDSKRYLKDNPDVKKSSLLALEHFSKSGWEELRSPGSAYKFDLIWYVDEYLHNWRNPINPLLHYAVCAKRRKLLTRPDASTLSLSAGMSLEGKDSISRICLFACYDPDGLIDEYVVQFIKELAHYSDIFFLADCELQPGELDKLSGIAKGAWAFRHGEYDFGSYSRLARDLVGWDLIGQYDELLLVNDSSYLLGSLKPVFNKMDAKTCDWWGLQATKGMSATRNAPSNTFKKKIDVETVFGCLLPSYEQDECYDFHIGSYFLAFRQPVLEPNGVLQRLLNGVRKERNKKNIIQRYEIGLTRRLLLAGYKPATFIDCLYPFHPIYTMYHFELVREGFPLLKRFLLTENHYHVPELWRWKEWLHEILPKVDLQLAEKNLLRTADNEKLYRALNISSDSQYVPECLLSDKEFIKEDKLTVKNDYCWVFPVCAYDHLLGGNERLLFEAIKDNPNIHKVILTRSKSVQLDGINMDVVPLKSLKGQRFLFGARYIFIKHVPRTNTIYPLDAELHRFINLWHGIPLKRIGYTSLDQLSRLETLSAEHARCHAVIASSKVDRLAMATAFYPLTFHDVWVTGLPRNDMILRNEDLLPVDFQQQLIRLRQALSGRRLILFAPTFRNAQAQGYYPFSEEERKILADCLQRHDAVLGIREHMADKAHSYSASLKGMGMPVISLDRRYYADIELIYREAALLITDYSSCFIDYMLTGKPEICFAFDYESYSSSERGLFYNLEDVFPGPICHDFPSLLQALDETLSGQVLESESAYKFKQKLFFDYVDDRNAERLLEHIECEIGLLTE
jgi:lipopolysaccharide biosynthesis protein/CDP-glycerol glycerophosphotransferase (TagB/SpsB family)